MRASRATTRILLAGMVLWALGCASARETAIPIQQGDLVKLAGTWSGFATGSGGSATSGELQLRPDGTYTNRVGGGWTSGTLRVVNGSLVGGPTGSAPGAALDVQLRVQLVTRGGVQYLSGTGTSALGPYSFEYSKR